MNQTLVAAFMTGTLIGATALADELAADQTERNPQQCRALFKKLDRNRDGKITESAAASEPDIAIGFKDPTVKQRGYLTPTEFIVLCLGSESRESGGI